MQLAIWLERYNQGKPKGDNDYIMSSTYAKAKDMSRGLILRDYKKISSRAIFYNIQ